MSHFDPLSGIPLHYRIGKFLGNLHTYIFNKRYPIRIKDIPQNIFTRYNVYKVFIESHEDCPIRYIWHPNYAKDFQEKLNDDLKKLIKDNEENSNLSFTRIVLSQKSLNYIDTKISDENKFILDKGNIIMYVLPDNKPAPCIILRDNSTRNYYGFIPPVLSRFPLKEKMISYDWAFILGNLKVK